MKHPPGSIYAHIEAEVEAPTLDGVIARSSLQFMYKGKLLPPGDYLVRNAYDPSLGYRTVNISFLGFGPQPAAPAAAQQQSLF